LTEQLPASIRSNQIEPNTAKFNSELEEKKSTLSADVYEKAYKFINTDMPALVQESYRPEKFYSGIVENFKDNFDAKKMSDVLNWFRSPLGKKLTQLENEAQFPESLEAKKDFFAQIQSTPIDPQRLKLIYRLDQATGSTKFITDLIMAESIATMQEMRPLFSDNPITDEKLEEKLKEEVAKRQDMIKNSTIASFLFTYRAVSDEDIIKYIEFNESESGKWFNQISQQGFLNEAASASEIFGKKLAKIMAELREDFSKKKSETEVIKN
jgi:hypothetical protein